MPGHRRARLWQAGRTHDYRPLIAPRQGNLRCKLIWSPLTPGASACRLLILAPNNALVQLVWERVYQTTQPTPPTNVWVTQDMTNNLYCIRDNQNYDTGTNFKTLATWAGDYQVRHLTDLRAA